MQKRYAAVLVVLILASFPALFAQSTGTISGTVRDSAGAVVPGAKIVITNDATSISRTAEADEQGHYSVPSLYLGSYRVTGAKEGFQTEVRTGVELTVGREAVVDFALNVGAVTQTLEVAGAAPLVESTSASLGSLVDSRAIRNLPLNGRSYDQLALLQPGVILLNPGPTSGAPFNSGTGKRFSVGGQRSGTNAFLLDGTDINDQTNGTPGGANGTNLGVDTILEFKVFTNSWKAEYGHSQGSVITAVTRSGTNEFHGTAFEYIRNSALDARNFFDVGSSPPSFRRNQFGGVIGGPIKKDKTFFFVGYEGLRQGLGQTLIAVVPTAQAKEGILPTGTVKVNPASVPFLNFYPNPNYLTFADGTGEFISSPQLVANQDNVMARVDHQLNSKHSLFVRYTLDRDDLNQPLSIPTETQVSSSQRNYATIQETAVFGPTMVNNFRVAFNRSNDIYNTVFTPATGADLALIPGQQLGQVAIGGVGASGTTITPIGSNNGNGLGLWVFNNFQEADDFSLIKGRHTLKFGVDVERIQDNYTNAGYQLGKYTFSTFSTLLAGTPSNFQGAEPLGVTPYWGLRQTLFGTYAQDDYKLSSRITLNLGLRWEAPTDPAEVNGKVGILPSLNSTATVPAGAFFSIGKKNFEPRFGLAWQLDASGKTVLRVGAGIFHNQILPWLYWSETRVPPYFITSTLTNPAFPTAYQALANATSLPTLAIMAPVDKTPVSDQYNVSIQRHLFRKTMVQVAYNGNNSAHLVTQKEEDRPIPTILADGQEFFAANAPRRNTAWSGIRYYETDGNADYNAGTVTLRRESSSGLEGQVFYTFSKSMDDASGTATSESVRSPSALMVPDDRRRDWSLSDFSSKQALGFTFSYALPVHVGSRFSRAPPSTGGHWTGSALSARVCPSTRCCPLPWRGIRRAPSPNVRTWLREPTPIPPAGPPGPDAWAFLRVSSWELPITGTTPVAFRSPPREHTGISGGIRSSDRAWKMSTWRCRRRSS